MHVCVHEVRGQAWCFCPLLSTLIFETVFFIEPTAHQFGWTGNQRDPGCFLSPLPRGWHYRCESPSLDSYLDAWNLNVGPALVWQALFTLSHDLSPRIIII